MAMMNTIEHEAEVQGLLSELMALGYAAKPPPPLSTQQAFDWVADCLLWLGQRAAPDLSVPRDYSSEQKRVAFLTSLGSQLFAKMRMRLHLRRLHRAGSSAVRELCRLAGLLSSAAAAPAACAVPFNQQVPVLLEPDRAQLRELSQRIGASGAQLVAVLTAAPAAAAGVAAARAATADVGAVERELKAGLAAARQLVGQLEQSVAALGQEVQMLEARVEKRHVELDRLERRLDSLQTVKPAFSAEVEELEEELAGLYQQYLHRFRNLEWLEGALDAHATRRQAEAEEADKQLRRIQRQVAAEEQRLLQGDQNGSPNPGANLADALDSDDSEAALGGWGPKALPRLGGGGWGTKAGAHVVGAGVGGRPGKEDVALDLQLLAAEEDERSGSDRVGGGGAKGSASRLSLASGGLAEVAAATRESSKVMFGGATLIPAHRGGSVGSPSSPARPGSAARHATAILRKVGGSSEAGSSSAAAAADVLLLDSPSMMQRGNNQADNNF